MARKSIDLRPEQVDINLYGPDAWSVEVTIAALGDITDAAVVARCKPDDGSATLTLDTAITDGPASKFTFGSSVPAPGKYDVQVTPSGGLARTYIYGAIRVQPDVA